MFKIKKLLILLISLLVPLQTVLNVSVSAQNKENKAVSGKHVSRSELYKNENWLQLSNLWKFINSNINSKDSNQNYKFLTGANEKAMSVIKMLKMKDLISDEESQFLEELINARVRYLEYTLGFIDCYYINPAGTETFKRREDLEKRYIILQKLFQENKITSNTFESTKDQIIDDIDFLTKNNKNKPSKNCLDLLIYLNK